MGYQTEKDMIMEYFIFGVLVFHVVLFIIFVRKATDFSANVIRIMHDSDRRIEARDQEKVKNLVEIAKTVAAIEKSTHVSAP